MGTTVNSNGTNIQIKDSYKGSGNYGNIIGEYDKSITTTGDYTENGEAKIEEMDLSASVEQDTNSDGIINFDVWNNYYETATKYLNEKRKTLEDMIIVSNDDWKTMKDKYPLLKSEASGFLNIFGSGKKIVSPEEIEARAEKNGGVLPADWLAKGITFEDYEKQYNEYIQEMTGMSYDEYKLELENIENTSQALKLKSYEFKQIEKQEKYKEIAATDEFQKYADENINNIDDMISKIEGPTLEERGSNALGGGTGKSANQNINYYGEYLTQDEKIMYMYLYDTKGRGFAESFLDAMADSLNQRKGFAEAQKVIEGVVDEDGTIDWGKAAKLFGDGTVDGMWNFCHDYVHFFDFGNDDVVMTDKQYKQMLIVQELSQYPVADQEAFNKCLTALGFDSVDDFYTMGNGIGNTILPSLTGVGAIGAIATGISSAGRSKDQAIVSGNNTASSYAYGLTVGITDGSMQYFLGNIEGIGKSVQPGFQGLVRQSLATGASVVSEGVAREVILGEDVDYNEVLKQATQAMVTDMASSIIRNGAGKIIRVGKDKIFGSSDGYVENITADNDTVQTNRVIEESDTSLHPQNSGRNRDIDADISKIIDNEVRGGARRLDVPFEITDYDRNNVLRSIEEYVNPNSLNYHDNGILKTDSASLLSKYSDVEIRSYLASTGVKINYDINASQLTGDINRIIQAHNSKYGDSPGAYSALRVLDEISDPNNPNYGKYNAITSQNGARDILKQYTPEQIRMYLDQMNKDVLSAFGSQNNAHGNGVFVFEEITNPNSPYYGKFDAVTSQGNARNILSKYNLSDIRYFLEKNNLIGEKSIFTGTAYNNNNSNKVIDDANIVYPTMDSDVRAVAFQNTIEENILEVIRRHDAMYGPGDAVGRLIAFLDFNDENHDNYNLITHYNGARDILSMYSPQQIRHALQNLNYINNGINSVSEYFSRYGNSKEGKYGSNQGGISSLCKYIYNGKEYTYREAMYMCNDALNNGRPLPHFEKRGSVEYFTLKNKLIKQGFSSKDASIIMSTVDDAGACSYAATVNEIFYAFKERESEFQQKFGYSMYKVENGKIELNFNELLLDLYVYVNSQENGGNFILNNNTLNPDFLKWDRHDVFGRALLDADRQVYLSSSYRGKNEPVIARFLISKDVSWYNATTLALNHGRIMDYDSFVANTLNEVYDELANGKSLSLDIYSGGNTINMISTNENLYSSVSTETWGEGGGHAVFITGIGGNGFYVSSWGREYIIPFKDLANGGEFLIYSSTIH